MSDYESPYDEHEDERRPCPECGGTRTAAGQDCPLCGPPSRPDPAVFAKAHRDAAKLLRTCAKYPAHPGYRKYFSGEADWHEARAAHLEEKGGAWAPW